MSIGDRVVVAYPLVGSSYGGRVGVIIPNRIPITTGPGAKTVRLEKRGRQAAVDVMLFRRELELA